eukprot:COSAG01_NODE_33_length_35013_cov_86.824144_11_plen_160_part_00
MIYCKRPLKIFEFINMALLLGAAEKEGEIANICDVNVQPLPACKARLVPPIYPTRLRITFWQHWQVDWPASCIFSSNGRNQPVGSKQKFRLGRAQICLDDWIRRELKCNRSHHWRAEMHRLVVDLHDVVAEVLLISTDIDQLVVAIDEGELTADLRAAS